MQVPINTRPRASDGRRLRAQWESAAAGRAPAQGGGAARTIDSQPFGLTTTAEPCVLLPSRPRATLVRCSPTPSHHCSPRECSPRLRNGVDVQAVPLPWRSQPCTPYSDPGEVIRRSPGRLNPRQRQRRTGRRSRTEAVLYAPHVAGPRETRGEVFRESLPELGYKVASASTTGSSTSAAGSTQSSGGSIRASIPACSASR